MGSDPRTSGPRRVEAYLDQILAPLARSLSPLHQDELRRELRDHLWARVDAYRELGMAEAEAVTEALRQFGGAEDFLRQWRREWRQTTPQATLREIWAATRCALRLSIPALLIAGIVSFMCQWYLPRSSDYYYAYQSSPLYFLWPFGVYGASGWTDAVFNLVLLPIGLGAAVGRLAPQRAGVGMLAALIIEVMLLSCWLIFAYLAHFAEDYAVYFPIRLLNFSVLWLPSAYLTAALTGWSIRFSQMRRLFA